MINGVINQYGFKRHKFGTYGKYTYTKNGYVIVPKDNDYIVLKDEIGNNDVLNTFKKADEAQIWINENLLK